uniref:Uncharacterized protein n=1 Tax=Rhizophora mucronata TaxID=61149 RepID=A0A2P2QQZ7_RHIMU
MPSRSKGQRANSPGVQLFNELFNEDFQKDLSV